MVTDQEPRYRLKDSNGNIVGTLFAESDGALKLQEGTSGNENELVLQSDGTVQAKRLSDTTLYAGAFPGSDRDARLDNALAAASGGERIRLESGSYEADRSISTPEIELAGAVRGFGSAAINADWTLDIARIILSGTVGIDGSLTVNGNSCAFLNGALAGAFGGISVQADRFRFIGNDSFNTVTYASGTTNGVAEANAGGTVVDNGSNKIGDTA